MKMNRFLSLSATLAATLLAAGCAAPGAGHHNPVDTVSNPNALVFTDVNVPSNGFTEVFVRDGTLTEPNRFRSIVPGLPQAQAKTILGGEPLRESDGPRGHEWDYNFKFVLEPSKNFIVCQYKMVFDQAQLVREQAWRRHQCQLLAEAQTPPRPAPSLQPAPAPAPTVLPIRSVNFDFDNAAGRQDALAILNADVAVLQRFPAMRVEIAGHTDLCGSAASNQKLSERRARMVYDYLVGKGVSPVRLVGPIGYGETYPLEKTPQTEPGCRSEKNRRTELNVLP